MKPITKYQADDNSVWDTEAACLKHESLCERVAKVMSAWPEHPGYDGCSFINGGGYIQLSEESVNRVKGELLDIIAKELDHRWVNETRDGNIHPSYVARLLCDCGNGPLYNAWCRLLCVDKSFREWGQPYYATDSAEGKQIELASI